MGRKLSFLIIAFIFLSVFSVVAVDYGGQWIVQDGDFCRGGSCSGNVSAPYFLALTGLCLAGDCQTVWPVGGGGSSWADADYQAVLFQNETGIAENSTVWLGTNGTHAWFNSWLLNLTIGELDRYNTSGEFFALFSTALQNNLTALNASLLTDINASYDEDYLTNFSIWRAITLNNWSSTIANNISLLTKINATYDEDYLVNISLWRAISLNNWSASLANNMSAAISANVSATAFTVAANLSATIHSNADDVLLNNSIKPWANNTLPYFRTIKDWLGNTLYANASGQTIELVQSGAGSFITSISISGNTLTENLGSPTQQNLFETINAPSGTDPIADSPTDTLNLVGGNNIQLVGSGDADDTILINTTDNLYLKNITLTGNLTLTGTAHHIRIFDANTGEYWDYGKGGIGIVVPYFTTGTGLSTIFGSEASPTTGMGFLNPASKVSFQRAGTTVVNISINAAQSGWIEMAGNLSFQTQGYGIKARDADGVGYTCCAFNNGAIACVIC